MVQVVLGRILLYRRRFDEAAFHVDRALSLNPNDTDVLVHAAMCRAYLGDGESALALGTKAMRLHPGFPPYYTAPVGLALFVLGRDAEVLAVGSQTPISTFVDIPAFLAASCALTGDLERARFYLEEFLSQLGDRITYGRAPDPGEPLRWLLHVNPFRRAQDIDRLEQGLRLAGLEEDPDERRPEAVARPVAQRPRRGAVSPRGRGVDAWSSTGSPSSSPIRRASAIWRGCSIDRELKCIASSWPTGRPKRPVPRRSSMSEPAARFRRAPGNCSTTSTRPTPRTISRRRNGRVRSSIRSSSCLSGALGLGGRSRALGSAAERARSAVTWRIRSGVKKIAKAHPQLGRHLENAVRTGTFCIYQPERPVEWRF